MAPTQHHPTLCQSLTPELRSFSIERTKSLLLKIARANFDTQYASKAASLVGFRDAISAHGSGSDVVLVEDFRSYIPLSDYDSYKPFMTVFDKHPCKEDELQNLFAPGLPSFLAISSATSGKGPKLFPKYSHSTSRVLPNFGGQTAMILFYGYREIKEVERVPGQIVKKIPVSIVSGGHMRALRGWNDIDDDENRMSLMIPGFVAPWAASMIKHYKSFLMVHALFALVCRDLDRIAVSFSTIFHDLARFIDEGWDLLLSSIQDGTVPNLPGVGEFRSHLQAHLHANMERATELREIGPPFSREGWATCVWPKLTTTVFICSGTFASVLPKIRSIIGPTIAIRTPGYGSSESLVAGPHRPEDLDTFVLRSNDLVEFLDVTMEESHKSLFQPWELEMGKKYEVVLTTNDGLWRYRLGDVVKILGFDAETGLPVFVISGRRSSAIRFPGMLVTDTHLSQAIQAVSPDVMQVNEFTTVLDDRQGTQTVGFFIELAETLGPNGHLAPMRLAKGLTAANTEFQRLLETASVRYPTVRIVRPGTFSEYRRWRAERTAAGPGQVKIPIVMIDPTAVEWILERVVGEL